MPHEYEHGDPGVCKHCGARIFYIEHQQGTGIADEYEVLDAWWAHERHPQDHHDAEPVVVRLGEEGPAIGRVTSIDDGTFTARPTPLFAREASWNPIQGGASTSIGPLPMQTLPRNEHYDIEGATQDAVAAWMARRFWQSGGA